MYLIRDIEDIQKKNEINDSNFFDSFLDSSSSKAKKIADNSINMSANHLVVYSLVTTSDKEINIRMYPDSHVRDMAKDKKWTTPYPKPLMLNHDIYGEPMGRFSDSWYVNHSDLEVEYGDSELPQAVLDEFVSRKSFGDGSGSVIGQIKVPSLDVKRKIIDGTYWTTSQGAISDSLTCNICNKSYWNGCSHMRGTNYPNMSEDGSTVLSYTKCVPFTGSLDAVEDSIVQRPANDTSSLIVFDSKAKKVINLTNVKDYENIFNIVSDENEQNGKEQQITTDNTIESGKVEGLSDEELANLNLNKKNDSSEVKKMYFRDSAKEVFMFNAKQKLSVKDDSVISALFDGLKDEEIEVALKVVKALADCEKVVPEIPAATKDGEGTTEKGTEQATTEDQTENSSLKKDFEELQTKFGQLVDAIKNIDGVNNHIPNILSVIDENNKVTSTNKNSRFKIASCEVR
ncbi:hypothetical protein VSU16_14895 (plasmid) [Cetobacterium somerae]|uniref:hypothetical protein n=1 Tax=Cetobacterium somerae TaxID=188913 RepID=UPI002E7BDCB4|nr:hypothetical protein [Cetobacterium somerae]WVJ03015.1 hypothetical protein VSU16_14895 [Cetobacterium somerae]